MRKRKHSSHRRDVSPVRAWCFLVCAIGFVAIPCHTQAQQRLQAGVGYVVTEYRDTGIAAHIGYMLPLASRLTLTQRVSFTYADELDHPIPLERFGFRYLAWEIGLGVLPVKSKNHRVELTFAPSVRLLREEEVTATYHIDYEDPAIPDRDGMVYEERRGHNFGWTVGLSYSARVSEHLSFGPEVRSYAPLSWDGVFLVGGLGINYRF